MKNKLIFTIILIMLLIVPIYAKTTLNVDVTGDDITDTSDVRVIAEDIINKTSISNYTDIDQDGKTKINDVMILLKNITGFIPITNLVIGPSSINLNVGDTYEITLSISPNWHNDDITYTSSNSDVASVNSKGKITAASTGTAVITATAASSSISAQMTINVEKMVVYNTEKESSTANYTYLYLNSTDKDSNGHITANLGVKINDTVASGISWSSSNPNVATINNNGTVTAVSLGKTTITASSGGYNATYTIRVKKKVVIVIGASQVNRLSCYVTNNLSSYAVVSTNHCAGTKTSSSTTYGSIKLGKYQYTTAAASIPAVYSAVSSGTALKRSASSLASIVPDTNKTYLNILDASRYSDTLNFIHNSGSGFEFQIGGDLWTTGALKYEDGKYSGWEIAYDIIDSYKDVKADVGFYIYFPIAGNGTKSYACNDWPSASSGDAAIFHNFVDDYIEMYNENIKSLNEDGYYAWGYIVSAHPLVPSNDSSGSIKYSDDATACNANTRSNLKYYLFNTVIEDIINNNYKYDGTKTHCHEIAGGKCLTYVDTFSKIMNVTIDNDKTNIHEKYQFKFNAEYGGKEERTDPTNYRTDDGLHWDADTVHEYLKLMLQDNSRLK